jgi:hypothetical protein
MCQHNNEKGKEGNEMAPKSIFLVKIKNET